MTITLRDTVTGQEVVVDDDHGLGWWAHGNGSCDCNRSRYFWDAEEEMDAEMRRSHPDLQPWQGVCYGAKRFLIVAADTDEYTLAELNESYPQYGGPGW